jgi:hypothetical protein
MYAIAEKDGANARGLGQITGNGIDALFRLTWPNENAYLNREIGGMYSYLSTTQPGALGPALLLDGEYAFNSDIDGNYLGWYNRIQNQAQSDANGYCLNTACEITFQLRSHLLANMDARNNTTNAELSETTEYNVLVDEMTRNVTYSALTFKAIREYEPKLHLTNPSVWNSLQPTDQIAISLAQYNVGAGNANSPVWGIVNRLIAEGKDPTWEAMAPVLAETPNERTEDPSDTFSGTVDYVNRIMELAEQGEGIK